MGFVEIVGTLRAGAARRLVVAAIASVALLACVPARVGATDAVPARYLDQVFGSVDVQSNLVYGRAPLPSGEEQDLKLDLYQPAGDRFNARPVVIYAHGGAFTKGNKESGHDWPYTDDFARRGFVAASIDYRLDSSETDATDDMQAAVRWFKAHADEYRIDPGRITVIGSSSGAVMALSTAFAPEDPGDSGNPGYPSNVAAALSISGDSEHPDTITPGDPPIAMFHAMDDTTIPYAAAEATCQDTQAQGNVCEMYAYPQGGHPPPFAIANRADIVQKSSDFLCRRILRPGACDPSKADSTPPVTTDDVPATYQRGPVTVTLTASDGGGSGVYRTYYTTGADPPEPTTASAVYDPAARPALADGERIKYFSSDIDGNAEPVESSSAAKVDGSPPATTDDVPAGYQRAPVPVTLTASDAGSGVAATYYTTGANPPDPTTASAVYDPSAKPTLGDGERIRYFSVDVAGNAEPVESSPAAMVDTTAPSSSASAPATVDSPAIGVDYTAADSGSGLERVELYAMRPGDPGYSLAATDSSPASSAHRFDYTADAGEGRYAFYTLAYDAAGNVEVAAGPDAVTSFRRPPPESVVLSAKTLTETQSGVVAVPLENPNRFQVDGATRLTTAGKRHLGLGKARPFSIAGGGRAAVRIVLSDNARKLLAERRKVPVRVALSTRGPGGTVGSTRTVVLRAPAKRSP